MGVIIIQERQVTNSFQLRIALLGNIIDAWNWVIMLHILDKLGINVINDEMVEIIVIAVLTVL